MSVVTLGFLLTFCCGSVLCQGQSKHATVVVEVTDPGGAGVPRAVVTFLPPPEDFSGQLETASDGKLTIKLKPGIYNLSVSCAGFKTFSNRFTVREAQEIQALSVGLQIAATGSPEVYPDAATPLKGAPLVTANCDPIPTLEISHVRTTLVGNEWKEDRVIDATVSKDGKPLPLAIVRLYIGNVLVAWTMADKRGHFLLENLTVGSYTLSIQDIGRFRLEVTPPRIHQQFFYSFSSNHGCLDWGERSD